MERNPTTKRGSLTIYLGYSPGVGKTYEMLSNAIDAYQEGADIKIGYIEPHQRKETQALAEKLPVIQTKSKNHGSHTFQYLDVDQIIDDAPAIILIDELAHTNISKERHEKRYMDIEEILSHGIDVHTTLNIQHIESLSEQVSLMTGVKVKERVPDQFIMSSDAIEVIDISPKQLINRLKTGKVYKKERLDTAFTHFFTYENLSELRELTLRTAADIMSQKEHLYKKNIDITPHIAVAISGSISNETVIREARRIANREHAQFTAVYIDVFDHEGRHYANESQVHQNLMLAQSLGASVKVIYDNQIASGLDDWCKSQKVTKLVIGQHISDRWNDIFKRPLIDQLLDLKHHYKIEIVPIKHIQMKAKHERHSQKVEQKRWSVDIFKMITIQAICVLLGLWVYNADKGEQDTIILLLFLLGIIVLSMWTQSYLIGFFAAILNVFVFNFFFTVPRFTFEVYRFDYPITFTISIIVSIVTSGLLKQIKHQYIVTKHQLYRTDILLQFNDSIKQTYTIPDLLDNARHQIQHLLNQEVTIYLVEDEKISKTIPIEGPHADYSRHQQALSWIIKNQKRAGATTDTFPGIQYLLIPIGTNPVKAIVSIHFSETQVIDSYDNSILESMLNEISLAVENLSLLRQTRESMLRAEREMTRSNFLRSISHDIRTPLTSIIGNLDVLLLYGKEMPQQEQHQLVSRSFDEAQYLHMLVSNILSLTKLEHSNVKLNRQLYLIEELVEEIGSVLERRRLNHQVKVMAFHDICFVNIDSKLILQAIFNLIENALKHTPPETKITLVISKNEQQILFEVIDHGPGLTDEEQYTIFQPFHKHQLFKDNKKDSMGLGLYLVQSILEKHGSQLKYRQNEPHGSIFYFNLPYEY
ncbi:sensor histidine kinase KdpD [Staphylococcus coagulans]|uniref:sensor histidine kinase n=1 Tax=Staphylococcus coagulans TaxID=74706 RepID=UPI001BE7DB59|nr:sensor histidine kinase KdpD [Staphylococcus coagulans]MBT2813194.1 sensor histidine kinase KdpD [Staphylococcus coagulans]MBT2815458.1 sensor histidine kinase KdpD [Staphylococcus coagulans]MBT2837154.1 sensor histidine kinase KdpD [Staphylococcus coagulans]MBT2841682.1 sensor histidine kinase KdpD [Staphylococcus coagulans]MBT2847481.1 sensor histidine kinase KdpD [Staphylococcus coagulans]